jgi:glycosyltransferase involved in cell wall biosynthesis
MAPIVTGAVRVHIVDPSAYTPPYDHALCTALAAQGADVELHTSRFAYGPLPEPVGYARREDFYSRAARARNPRARRAVKLVEHVPDMLAYRRRAKVADVVHFQWLALQYVDGVLLPRGRPLVLTAHDVLPREPRPGQRASQRRLYRRFDAVVVHSEDGARRLERELGLPGGRVHVIPHGALEHLTAASSAAPAPAPAGNGIRRVLFFGLLRPYKGLDVLLEAWEGIEGAELWIVGMPRMDTSELRARGGASVHFVERFVDDGELAEHFRRADLVVLPYREADQSGVLATALAFGTPLLLSDVGGFPEVARTGAARCVAAGDADALRRELRGLLGDPDARAQMRVRARAAAEGPYSFQTAARATLELYESLLAARRRPSATGASR